MGIPLVAEYEILLGDVFIDIVGKGVQTPPPPSLSHFF